MTRSQADSRPPIKRGPPGRATTSGWFADGSRENCSVAHSPSWISPQQCLSIDSTTRGFGQTAAIMSSTLLPFLYHTKTLQRAGGARVPSVRTLAIGLGFHSTALRRARQPRAKDNSIPFENAPTVEEDVLSTITPTERQIFSQIFSDIAKKGSSPQPPNRATSATSTSTTFIKEAGSGSRSVPLIQRLRDVVNRDSILQKYPRSLRHAAELALGVHAQIIAEETTTTVRPRAEPNPEALKRAIEWQELRKAERERVEALMRSCNTDKELWDCVEKEIFSIPRKVGILTGTGVATPPSKRPSSLNLNIYGPLYPVLLSGALTMLCRDFGPPSPLAFGLLPRIRELGLVPYVLGISTPLFNELIGISWKLHGDLGGVLDLLSEMEYAGLRFDKATQQVLQDVEQSLSDMLGGRQQAFPRVLMKMPEYDSSLRSALSWRLASVKDAVNSTGSALNQDHAQVS
jgi:hypothetical protein